MRVEHDAVADDAFAAGAEDAAGDELQDKLLAVDDDGVAGVVAAGVAGDDVELFAEDVDDLALAFIAPLGSKDDGGRAAVRARRDGIFGLAHEEDGSGGGARGEVRAASFPEEPLAPMIHFIPSGC